MDSACGTYGVEEKCLESFGGETWRRRPLGRPRHRWQGTMKMDIREIGWDSGETDSYGLGPGQVVGCSKCGNACLDFLKCGEFLVYLKNC
jgi:hypothetical protein